MTNLQAMTPDELYALNAPLLAKQYTGEPLSAEEQALHAAIIAQAEAIRAALREREIAEYIERAKRLALADD